MVPFLLAFQETNSVNKKNKWVVFGCSYSGALSAWYRLKFPQKAVASFSGSSPVEATASFYQYDQIVAASLGTIDNKRREK